MNSVGLKKRKQANKMLKEINKMYATEDGNLALIRNDVRLENDVVTKTNQII